MAEVDKDRGLFVDPKLARTPLADVATAWLESNPGKRGGSWQRDEIVVRRHIVPALGDRPVGSLTPGDIQAVVNRWAAARAPRTVRREYGVLQSIVNYAIRLDMLGRSPCRGINLPKATPIRRHVVDSAELARLAKGLGGVGRLAPPGWTTLWTTPPDWNSPVPGADAVHLGRFVSTADPAGKNFSVFWYPGWDETNVAEGAELVQVGDGDGYIGTIAPQASGLSQLWIIYEDGVVELQAAGISRDELITAGDGIKRTLGTDQFGITPPPGFEQES